MADPTLQMISSPTFVPDKYVTELSQNCVGGQELVRLKKKVHSLFEETNDSLKRNVYQNYMQFIDTAKEISHLESEMYQLSHLLSEQRTLLQSLYNTSILGDDTAPIIEETSPSTASDEQREEEARRQKLVAIFEKVEGCTNMVDAPNRKLLHEGFLAELDPVENTPLKSVYAFLFSDGLMIAVSNSNTLHRGMRFTFETLYDLNTLAVVNVKDIYMAFKLLAFPDTRVFQCKSNNGKMDWVKKIDLAKRSRLAQDQMKRESVDKPSPSKTASIDAPSSNSFDMQEDEAEQHPDWLLDIGEELDVCIAQRHFEQALTALQKGRDYIDGFSKQDKQLDHILVEIQRKINQKFQVLTDVLMRELEVSSEKSLQGGLRAARRAVRLLNQLDRSTQACDLFLKFCSSLLKSQCKRVKREGSTIIYVRNFAGTVFSNICNMTEEFLRAFPNSPSGSSAFIVWVSKELHVFATHFVKHVFVPQSQFTVITDCVLLAITQCERLQTYGVDLSYQLHGALRAPLSKALQESQDKMLDAIKLRALDDKWRPMNMRSRGGLTRLLQEYNELGIALDGQVTGDCWVQLTSNTLAFTKQYLAFMNDCLNLKSSNILYSIDKSLVAIFETQLRFCEQAVKSETNAEQRQFVTVNVNFLVSNVLGHCLKKYESVNGFACSKLAKLATDFKALSRGVTPTSRNIAKYSSNEYL